MTNYLTYLKRAGAALIIVGLLDIGLMVYCILNDLSYSSSLNIFAVIAGIFLIRGSLQTVVYVRVLATFMLTGFIGFIFVYPFLEPLDLMLTKLSLNPISSTLSFMVIPLFAYLVYWVYKALSKEAVIKALKENNHGYHPPYFAAAFGIILITILSITMYFMNNSSSAAIAKSKAIEQLGNSYKYHITAIRFGGNHVSAQVTAYNSSEIRTLNIEWDE